MKPRITSTPDPHAPKIAWWAVPREDWKRQYEAQEPRQKLKKSAGGGMLLTGWTNPR